MKQLFMAACGVVVIYLLVRFFPVGILFLPFIPLTAWAARKCKTETGSYKAFAEGMAYTVITMLAVSLVAFGYHMLEVAK